jgi:hypothetical protein
MMQDMLAIGSTTSASLIFVAGTKELPTPKHKYQYYAAFSLLITFGFGSGCLFLPLYSMRRDGSLRSPLPAATHIWVHAVASSRCKSTAKIKGFKPNRE